jgi:hypothetical protein
MTSARAPGAPIFCVRIRSIGEAVTRGHWANQLMASTISISVPSAMR